MDPYQVVDITFLVSPSEQEELQVNSTVPQIQPLWQASVTDPLYGVTAVSFCPFACVYCVTSAWSGLWREDCCSVIRQYWPRWPSGLLCAKAGLQLRSKALVKGLAIHSGNYFPSPSLIHSTCILWIAEYFKCVAHLICKKQAFCIWAVDVAAHLQFLVHGAQITNFSGVSKKRSDSQWAEMSGVSCSTGRRSKTWRDGKGGLGKCSSFNWDSIPAKHWCYDLGAALIQECDVQDKTSWFFQQKFEYCREK